MLHPLLQPYVPTPADPFDSVKAAHLLNRAGFGGKPAEIAAIVELGPRGAIDALLDFPDAPVEEQTQTDLPNLSSIEGYPKNFEERRRLTAGKTDDEKKAILQQLMMKNREAMAATMQWWLARMAFGPCPLQEKLAFFWHGHFTTSARDERAAFLMWQQNETIRTNAAGNFRNFVRQISRDPAMLDYLNNQQNRKEHPNENYARELMELFTLGIGNYSETDVKEAARAFTGWGHDGESYLFRKFDHDTGTKNFLGRRGNLNGDDVIEIILQHPACAPYVTTKLLKFFVTDDPPPAVVQNLAAILRENNYDLRPVLRTMFTSKYFYSPEVIGSQIKCPVQLVVGTMRMLDVEPPQPLALVTALDQMGQVPFAPPNVKGWPSGRDWINTSTLFVRYNTALWLAGGGDAISASRGSRLGKFVPRRELREPSDPVAFDPKSSEGSAEDLVDAWLDRLIQRPVGDDRRKVLIDALGKNPSVDALKKVVQLIVSMPEYQLC